MRAAALAAVLGTATLVASCDDPFLIPETDGGGQFSIKLEPVGTWVDTILVGSPQQFTARAVDSRGRELLEPSLVWTSETAGRLAITAGSDATVRQLNALLPGTGRFNVKIEGAAFAASPLAHEVVAVLSGVLLSATDTMLTAIGDTLRIAGQGLDASDAPVNGTGVTWSVRGTGAVDTLFSANRDSVRFVAKALGTDTVTVTHAHCVGACTRTMVVGVVQVPHTVQAVTRSGVDTVTLRSLGQADTLAAVVRDRRGNVIPGALATWSYSADATAADSAAVQLVGGIVTAAANTSAPVKLVVAAGEARDTARVRVWQHVVRVDALPAVLTLVGSSAADTVDVRAYDARDRLLQRPYGAAWSSRDESVATVARLSGDSTRALVSSRTAQGNAVLDVVVESTAGELAVDVIPPISRIEVTPAADTINALGHQRQLRAVAYDSANVALSGITFRWTSSDTAVARVDGDGLVTARGTGAARVVAALGEHADSSSIHVRQVIASVAVEPQSALMLTGDTLRLTVTARDSAGTAIPGLTFAWASSDTTKATVSSSGLVTAVREGSATIRATTGSSSGSAAIAVQGQIAEVVTKSHHTCMLSDAGALYCWGLNDGGQLGDGTSTDRPAPVRVLGGHVFTSVAVGDGETCAVTSTGALYCWGGGTVSTPTAVTIPGGEAAAKVVMGNWHTCVLTTSGKLHCRGHNWNGQLGDGTSTDRGHLAQVQLAGVTWTDAAAGESHTCGVTSGGEAYCWGVNWSGQLGNGMSGQERVTLPTRVSSTQSWASISAGGSHSCALNAAGAAYCWGAGGKLGEGTHEQRTTPAAVHGSHTFRSISAGRWAHTCAVRADDQLLCWGGNYRGQLGDGTTTHSNVPIVAAGGLMARTVSAGADMSCSVSTRGEVWCWGHRRAVGLGDGIGAQVLLPQEVPGLPNATDVQARSNQHACALTEAGQIYCWGANWNGQLGQGTTSELSGPVLVSGQRTYTAVGVGEAHSCGLTDTGRVFCWGANWNGQLGTGNTTHASIPVEAAVSGVTFRALALGNFHTCAVSTGNVLYCWGYNGNGELGIGTSTDARSPTAVAVQGQAVQTVDAGRNHTCAVTTSGAGYCWGFNGSGQLGIGTTSDQWSPQAVLGGISFRSVHAGYWSTCGIDTSNRAYCWGYGGSGNLGNGSWSDAHAPVLVSGGRTWSRVAVGEYAACGITTAGETFCWGGNWEGAFGNGARGSSNVPATAASGLGLLRVSGGHHATCGATTANRVHCWGARGNGVLGDGQRSFVVNPVRVGG